MEELMEYFETQGTTLEDVNASFVDGFFNPPSGYVSKMKVRGTPLLPPLMTKKRKEECLTYRHQAVLAEARLRGRRREKLLAKVQEALDSVTDPNEGVVCENKGRLMLRKQPDFEGVVLPDNITCALSPVRDPASLKFSETLTSTTSDVDSMGITSSYMFQSSDSSECQTTVIARDENSHFKQVVQSLKEEKEREQNAKDETADKTENGEGVKDEAVPSEVSAPEAVSEGGKEANDATSLPGLANLSIDARPEAEAVLNGLGSGASSERSVGRVEVGLNSAARMRRRNESGSSKSSSAFEDDTLSEYRELPASAQSKVLGKALDVLKDVAKTKEKPAGGSVEKSKESVDKAMFVSGDSNLMCTASTDIMQYMKTSVGTMDSSTNTLHGSPVQPDDDAQTLTNTSMDADAQARAISTRAHNVVHITGVETGESSTDPAAGQMGAPSKPDESAEMSGLSTRRGKQDHLRRYLQQLGSQPSFGSINQRTSANLEDLGTRVTEMSISTDLNTVQMRPFSYNFEINAAMPEEEILQYQASHFEEMRKRLELQQRQQLAHLLWEQQQEQLRLQQDLLDQEDRVRRAQRKLIEQQSGSFGPGAFQISHGSPVPQYEDSSEEDFSQRSPCVRSEESKSVDTTSGHSQEIEALVDRNELMRHSEPAYVHSQTGPTSPVIRRKPIIKVPEKALAPEMKPKFDRISATVKGYLTRRLLRTEKVQELIKTIKDTAEFAINFQSETPIKKGIYSVQDITLQERVIAQLRAALLEIHEIFFEYPVHQRLAIITHSRQLEDERRLKEMSNRRSGNFSQPPVQQKNEKRISAATVKAIERKKKAKVAEDTVFTYANQARPKTAPPDPKRLKTLDISGPLRRQFQSIFNRALRPIQGQTSPAKPVKEETHKSMSTDRPKTAPSKPGLQRETSLKTKRTDMAIGGTKKASTKTTTQQGKTKYSQPLTRATSVNNKLRR